MMKPILGITMGDPSGIGPEITAKALAREDVYAVCRPLVVGSAAVLAQAIRIVNAGISINAITDIAKAKYQPKVIDVLDQDLVDVQQLKLGVVSQEGGHAAFLAVDQVINLALENRIDGTVTGPLNKEALNLAGWHYAGHTEIFAEKTNTTQYAMMLAHEDLRVVHVSTHVSLREACQRCTLDRVFDTIALARQTCQSLGIQAPRIGVAGLNPHAGENGLFGTEEIEHIAPAVEKAQNLGWDVQGPIPPDSIFPRALGGQFDIVVAQYHDQGHIPLKLVGFQFDKKSQKWSNVSGVNITLGLPIIRCSVDHGTAFDQAGKGTATEESLVNAIQYAAILAKNRKQGL